MKRIELMRQKLEAAFTPQKLKIYDESLKHFEHGGERARPETYFFIEIISEEFENIPRSDRHKMINDAVNDVFRGAKRTLEIHALAPNEI